jgi:hypothetical protein
VTVLLSVVAHGLSAPPLAARYGTFTRTLRGERPEHVETPGMRSRRSLGSQVGDRSPVPPVPSEADGDAAP